jgi:hypothetical protein
MNLFEKFPVNSPMVLKLITELLNSRFEDKIVDEIDYISQIVYSDSVDVNKDYSNHVKDIQLSSLQLYVNVCGYSINQDKHREKFDINIPFIELIAFLKYS